MNTAKLLHNNKLLPIIEKAENIIFIITYDGIIYDISANCLELLGYGTTELVGQSLSSFIHSDDQELYQDCLSKFLTTGKHHNKIQYRLKHKDGCWRWHRSSLSVINDCHDNVLYILGVSNDITENKSLEEILAEKIQLANFRAEIDKVLSQSHNLEELMQGCTEAMVKHLHAAFARIWTLNTEEKVLELQVSSGMYTHIDGPHGRVPVGQFKIGLIAAEAKPLMTNSVQTAPRVGDKEWAKREGMIAFAGYPLMLEGEILGVVAMFSRQPLQESIFEALRITAHEISLGIRRKHTEEELRKSEARYREIAQTAQEKAEQLEAALLELKQTQSHLIQTEKMSSLGQLVAGIAHEINNPVNFIYGNISHTCEYLEELLSLIKFYQQNYDPNIPALQEIIDEIDLDFILQDLPKVLDSMKIGAERIRQIVLSLRHFSYLQEEGMKAIDIHQGINDTLLLLQHRLKGNSGLEIEVIKQYGNLPNIICHGGQLNQVFMNLLSNAIDALEERRLNNQSSGITATPKITIRTEITSNQEVLIRIADNGAGMTEEVQSRLFDPFFTTKPVGKGTGMGLSISYQIIVRNHDGELNCISTPGKGSEFIIAIPFRESEKVN